MVGPWRSWPALRLRLESALLRDLPWWMRVEVLEWSGLDCVRRLGRGRGAGGRRRVSLSSKTPFLLLLGELEGVFA